MWVARDKDERLVLFTHKPIRCKNDWKPSDYFWMYLSSYDEDERCIDFVSDFKTLSWGDEPIEVELTLKALPIKFRLSEETKKIIEKDTGKTIEEIKKCPLYNFSL